MSPVPRLGVLLFAALILTAGCSGTAAPQPAPQPAPAVPLQTTPLVQSPTPAAPASQQAVPLAPPQTPALPTPAIPIALTNREVLNRAEFDVANPPSAWILPSKSGDAIGWTPGPGELLILVDPRPLIAAGLNWQRLPVAGWRYQEASLGLHGHHPVPERLIRLEQTPKPIPASRDAAADLAALLAQRPQALVSANLVRFAAGDGFAWTTQGLRLELLLAPLEAAGLDRTKLNPAQGWRVAPAASGQPARLVREAPF